MSIARILCFVGWHTWRHSVFENNPPCQVVACEKCGRIERRYGVKRWVTK